MSQNNLHSRRQMFTSLFRYAAAGLMGLSVFASLAKNRKLIGTDQSCINHSICKDCAIYGTCRLPKALSRKQSPKESSHAG